MPRPGRISFNFSWSAMGTRRASCRQWNQWPKEIEQVDVVALRADLKKIRNFGKKAFVVVNPGTPLCEEILNDCDGVLIMSVNPGFAGQKFMPEVLPKLQRLKEIFKGDIAIDGGINAETAPLVVQAGAHVLDYRELSCLARAISLM